MASSGRLSPEVLRRRNAQLHDMLRAAGTTIKELLDRIAVLDAENRFLKEERDGR